MRFKRAKKTKRNMGIYCHSFGFRSPYQIILDGNFLQVARLTGKKLEEALPQFLGDQVRMMTTYCVYAELKKLGQDFRPTAAYAKKLEKRRCTHSPAITAAECIKEIMGTDNKNNYCIATQDPDLRDTFRSIPGVPLIYISKSVLLLEPASNATMEKVSELEIKKTQLQEFEKPVSIKSEEVQIVKRKRKEPNPLSVKKKKTVVSDNTKVNENESTGSKRKRKRKQSNAITEG